MPTAKPIEGKSEEETLEQFLYDEKNNYMPSPQDVKQSEDVGDCYLLAALITLADKDPKFIKDTLITFEGDKIVVSLHGVEKIEKEPKKGSIYQSQIIYNAKGTFKYKLTKDEIEKYCKDVDYRCSTKWIAAVELAYTKHRKAGREIGIKQLPEEQLAKISPRAALAGGVSAMPYTAITGKQSKSKTMANPKDRKDEEGNLIRKFPEKGKYSPYCEKVRHKICKHIQKGGQIVVAFDNTGSNKGAPLDNGLDISKRELLNRLLKMDPAEIPETDYYNMLLFHPPAPAKGMWDSMTMALAGFTETDSTNRFAGYGSSDEIKKFFELAQKPDSRITKSSPEYKKALKEHIVPYLALVIQYYWINSELLPQYHIDPEKFCEGFATSLASKPGVFDDHTYAVLDCFEEKETGYWYVTLKNPHGTFARIKYDRSKRYPNLTRKEISFDPEKNQFGIFNMELAHLCKCMTEIDYT